MNIDDEIINLLSDEKTLKKGFEKLVSQYSERLYWQVRRIVITHEDANDVVQNAFVKAWLNLGEFHNKSRLSTWLSRIAINEALDFVRRKQRHESVSTDDEPSVSQQLLADEYFDGNETEAQLQEAISLLPDVQRTVFTLRYFEEMKYSEISAILGTSEGALKSSYHLAVKKIEEFFNSRD